jgi:hypothetical protein
VHLDTAAIVSDEHHVLERRDLQVLLELGAHDRNCSVLGVRTSTTSVGLIAVFASSGVDLELLAHDRDVGIAPEPGSPNPNS